MGCSRSTRGQVWIFDFFVAILIFSSTLLIYFEVRSEPADTREDILEEMIEVSKLASSDLMSEGYPSNWTTVDAERIGLQDISGRFDEAKMEQFLGMDADTARSHLQLGAFRYFAFFERPLGEVIVISGDNESGEIPSEESLVVQTTRLGVYSGEFIQLRLLLWRLP